MLILCVNPLGMLLWCQWLYVFRVSSAWRFCVLRQAKCLCTHVAFLHSRELSVQAGTILITSTDTTKAVMDVFPSVAGFAANAIAGRIAAASAANALYATEGGNVLFRVCAEITCFAAVTTVCARADYCSEVSSFENGVRGKDWRCRALVSPARSP